MSIHGYQYIEKIRVGVQWYMMESKDIISSICFKLKNENGNLVSFNSQSVIFRLYIKEIYFSTQEMPSTLIKLRLHSNKHKPKIKQEPNRAKLNFIFNHLNKNYFQVMVLLSINELRRFLIIR